MTTRATRPDLFPPETAYDVWVREFVEYLRDQGYQWSSEDLHDWAYEAAEDPENRKLRGADAAKREISQK
jgi:hypothetical protein